MADLDVCNSSSVFFEGSFHDLSLMADLPDSNFTLHTSGNNSLAVIGWHERCNSVVVSVVDGIEEFSRLGQEGSDLTIVPA